MSEGVTTPSMALPLALVSNIGTAFSMLREMPAPKFIEVGQPVVAPPTPPADLNWQRVEEFLD